MEYRVSFSKAPFTSESLSQRIQREKIKEDILGVKRKVDPNPAPSSLFSSGLLSLDSSGYSLQKEEVLSAQERAQFIKANRDLLSVIDGSDEAKEFLKKTEIRSRDDLVRVIAQTAQSLLTGEAKEKLDEATLKEKPLVGSLIVLNLGSFRDSLNQDPKLADELLEGPSARDSFAPLAAQAKALFKEDSPLSDEEFFKANPKAAIYVLNHPDLVRDSFTAPSNADDNARQFKDLVKSEAYQDLFDNYLAEFAADATQSGVFNEDFFADSDNLEVAEYVGAGQYTENVPTPAEFLKKNPAYGLENLATQDRFNSYEFATDVTVFQAKNLLGAGHALDSSTLKNYSGLSRLLVNHENLREAFKKDDVNETLRFLVEGEKGNGNISDETLKKLEENFRPSFENPRKAVSIIV